MVNFQRPPLTSVFSITPTLHLLLALREYNAGPTAIRKPWSFLLAFSKWCGPVPLEAPAGGGISYGQWKYDENHVSSSSLLLLAHLHGVPSHSQSQAFCQVGSQEPPQESGGGRAGVVDGQSEVDEEKLWVTRALRSLIRCPLRFPAVCISIGNQAQIPNKTFRSLAMSLFNRHQLLLFAVYFLSKPFFQQGFLGSGLFCGFSSALDISFAIYRSRFHT